MQLRNKRIVLTGASSGIGLEMARELAMHGAHLVLVGRRKVELENLVQELSVTAAGTMTALAADVTTAEGRAAVIAHANKKVSGIDILINNAGVSDFNRFDLADPATIEAIYKTNVLAPVLLTQAVLPQLLAQAQGRIVNMGSIFGSIGFAYFAAYSSSKFALRGFSEALRRELAGSGVGVTYLAPRSVRTAINSAAVYRMAEAVKMKMDEPATIAKWIVRSIANEKQDAYFGLAETFFVKLNGLFPRLIDKGLDKQNRQMGDFVSSDRI